MRHLLKNRQYLRLDGTNDAVSFSTFTPNTTAFTIMFWFKPIQGNTANDRLIDWQDSGPVKGFTLLQATASNPQLTFNIHDGSSTVASMVTKELRFGVWSMVTITYTSNEAKLYVNLNKQASSDTSVSMSVPSASFYIGRRATTASNFARGLISDFVVLSRVATPAEISDYFFENTIPSTPSLYLPFNDGSGTTAVDNSGNNHNGTLAGTPVWGSDTQTRSSATRSVATGRSAVTRLYIPDDLLTLVEDRNSRIYYWNGTLWSRSITSASTLQKSTDEGATWTNLATLTYSIEHPLVTEDGSVIVGQDPDNDYFAGGSVSRLQLYKSSDGGVVFGGVPVKSFSQGGMAPWSFSIKGNTIYVGEYGEYNAVYVYKSTDSGATWSTVFTHPAPTSGTSHIHKVYQDPYVDNMVYVSYGDNDGNRGLQYSLDGGDTWSIITESYQPTQVVADSEYLYIGEDVHAGGNIVRISKSKLINDTYTEGSDYETVYTASADTRGNFGNIAFYGCGIDSYGNLYFGGVTYGSSHGGGNNKNGLLITSGDYGESWNILEVYPTIGGSTVHGPTYFSEETSSGYIYMFVGGVDRVYRINTSLVNRYLNS